MYSRPSPNGLQKRPPSHILLSKPLKTTQIQFGVLLIRDRLLRLAWVRLFSSSGCLYFDCRHYQRFGGRGGAWVALVLVRTAAKKASKACLQVPPHILLPRLPIGSLGSPKFFFGLFPLTAKLGVNRAYSLFSPDHNASCYPPPSPPPPPPLVLHKGLLAKNEHFGANCL